MRKQIMNWLQGTKSHFQASRMQVRHVGLDEDSCAAFTEKLTVLSSKLNSRVQDRA